MGQKSHSITFSRNTCNPYKFVLIGNYIREVIKKLSTTSGYVLTTQIRDHLRGNFSTNCKN